MPGQLCARNGEFNARFSSLLLAPCCVASGLSYISGGPLLMSLGIACILHAKRIFNPRVDPAARAGWILFGLGVASLILQLVLVTQRQGSLLEHNHAVASVFPNDRRYWLFFLALYGRALGYDGTSVFIDAGLAALILAPGVFLGIRRLVAGSADTSGSRGIGPLPVTRQCHPCRSSRLTRRPPPRAAAAVAGKSRHSLAIAAMFPRLARLATMHSTELPHCRW